MRLAAERAKKTEPISFRIEDKTFAELEAAALSEHRKRGELARLLFEWAFEKYKEAGSSYDALIGRHADAPPGEREQRRTKRA